MRRRQAYGLGNVPAAQVSGLGRPATLPPALQPQRQAIGKPALIVAKKRGRPKKLPRAI